MTDEVRNERRPGRELLYGLHAVRARVTQHARSCERMMVQSDLRSTRLESLQELARRADVPIEFASGAELDRMAGGKHQGVVLLCTARGEQGESRLAEIVRERAGDCLLLLLDGVTDPHNLGACLRSAAAMGVDAVVTPKDRSAALTPAAVKVASGAVDLVPLIRVTNLARTIDELKRQGIWIIGLSVDTDRSITETDLTGPVALILGSEGGGLRQLTARKCDLLTQIPLGRAALGGGPPAAESGAESADGPLIDSLNVSVATGIALYEVTRQRRAKRE